MESEPEEAMKGEEMGNTALLLYSSSRDLLQAFRAK